MMNYSVGNRENSRKFLCQAFQGNFHFNHFSSEVQADPVHSSSCCFLGTLLTSRFTRKVAHETL